METVCTCNSFSTRTRLINIKASFCYKNVTYPFNVKYHSYICHTCFKIWNDSPIAYTEKVLERLTSILNIVMKEVSLKVAVLRAVDYLANGYYNNGVKIQPLKLDKDMFGEMYDLTETVLSDIYWGSVKGLANHIQNVQEFP